MRGNATEAHNHATRSFVLGDELLFGRFPIRQVSRRLFRPSDIKLKLSVGKKYPPENGWRWKQANQNQTQLQMSDQAEKITNH